MKRLLLILLCISLMVFGVAGCSKAPGGGGTTPTGGSVKTGLAVISTIAKSVDATAAKNGSVLVDSTVVAVLVDNNDKIIKCVIDGTRTNIDFDLKGKIITPINTIYDSKQVLGEKYGMKKASSIGKEWSEEANAFAKYVVGKTADQVKGIAINQQGAPTDKELASSVTLSSGGFIDAIQKAIKTAQNLGAKSTDKLGIGITTAIANSKDATANNAGVGQAYSYYTATSFDTSSKISGCILDASQTNVNFGIDGKISTDLKTNLQTKNELADLYGMKKASSIGKEWNEEAAAFAKYITGKTLTEIKNISVNEKKEPTDAELKGSVTISIGDFITVIDKAYSTAK